MKTGAFRLARLPLPLRLPDVCREDLRLNLHMSLHASSPSLKTNASPWFRPPQCIGGGPATSEEHGCRILTRCGLVSTRLPEPGHCLCWHSDGQHAGSLYKWLLTARELSAFRTMERLCAWYRASARRSASRLPSRFSKAVAFTTT